MIDNLLQLGLSRSEAAVYKALLDVGPCFVAPLVRETRKHRQIVYNALETLEKKQFVSVAQKNGKHFYSIGDPQRLVLEMKQKLIVAEGVSEQISQKLHEEREQVESFNSGSYAEAVADFRRHAEEAQEYIAIRSGSKEWFPFVKPFFREHVEELRRLQKLGIAIQILFTESEREVARQFIGPHLNDPYICKIYPEDELVPHTVWLAGDHVYIVTPVSEPLVVHIHSKALAKQYRDYFWRHWSAAKPLQV